MATNDKILKALETALNRLDEAISALKSINENAFSNGVWHVAAELEYALFLFSLAVGSENSMPVAKPNPEIKNMQMDNIVLKVKELVGEAQKSIMDGHLLNAYRSAYLARHFIFKVQESLNKKKHEASRK
jgi:hypothetical protein